VFQPTQVLGILSQLDIRRLSLDDIEEVTDEPDCIWARMVLDLLGTPGAVEKTLEVSIRQFLLPL
jgi:hypothetical protein